MHVLPKLEATNIKSRAFQGSRSFLVPACGLDAALCAGVQPTGVKQADCARPVIKQHLQAWTFLKKKLNLKQWNTLSHSFLLLLKRSWQLRAQSCGIGARWVCPCLLMIREQRGCPEGRPVLLVYSQLNTGQERGLTEHNTARRHSGAAKETAQIVFPQIPNSAERGEKEAAGTHKSIPGFQFKTRRGRLTIRVLQTQIQQEERDSSASGGAHTHTLCAQHLPAPTSFCGL